MLDPCNGLNVAPLPSYSHVEILSFKVMVSGCGVFGRLGSGNLGFQQFPGVLHSWQGPGPVSGITDQAQH